jgi:predicted dinucleotide-binding enzyme
MPLNIALVGAGGKMGCRLTDNLKNSAYTMRYIEVSDAGIERLTQRSVKVSSSKDAVPQADIVILAVPDIHIGKVSNDLMPLIKSGSIVVTLDPAAAVG